jgi:hypothetical protein
MVEKTDNEDKEILREVVNQKATEALEDGSATSLVDALREIEELTAEGAILLFDYDNRTVELDENQDGDEQPED